MKKYVLVFFLSLLCNLSFSKDIKLKNPVGICNRTISLNGNDWRIATDSSNAGRQNLWFQTPPVSASKQTPVPWVIQDIFHNYHGVVWYWREFNTPRNLHRDGRYLLKFHAVDYLAEVWINGKSVGGHEGSETPFEMDVTDALRAEGKNLLVVRVLNPTYQPIEGIALKDTPSGGKQYPVSGNTAYNSGGIIGSVELSVTPAVYIKDLFVVPDWKLGKVKIQATVLNTRPQKSSSSIAFNISEAQTGIPVILENYTQKIDAGSNLLEVEIQVPEHKLWSPDDPVLYRLTASAQTLGSNDEKSVRFGFRNFRFENGYFRLNGKRIFLNGLNFSTHFPVGYTVPLTENMLRKDVVNMKALGFNFVRIPFGCPNPRELDIYDELGILVQMEHYGCWQMGDYNGYKYPKPDNSQDLMLLRYEHSIRDVVLRDRNHASVVMWGMLNETYEGALFQKAVSLLPPLRILDPSRIFILNSGRFDKKTDIGSMSNPGSTTWNVGDNELKDWHPYPWIPYSAKSLDELSGISATTNQKFYLSETGLCAPVNIPFEIGDYQQHGKEQSDEAVYFKHQYDKFMTDWQRWKLSECWVNPENYITDAYKATASLREMSETAIRSNPFVISYTPTMGVADSYQGESVATSFRRLKPELIGSVLLANTSLRWCLSTEPQSIYRGNQIQLRVSFSNLDILKAGKYPATIQVFDPDLKPVYEKKVLVNIPEAKDGAEPPFAQSILTENITISGPTGKYQFLATLDQGGTAMGGTTEFYVTDQADLPKIPGEVVLCGTDSIVRYWFKEHKVKILPLDETNQSKRQVILIAGKAQDSITMLRIARQMAGGSVAIFLSPETLKKGKNLTYWLPLAEKGIMRPVDDVGGYYRSDRWAKNHPIFEGMPSGGIMDYKYFRNIISLYALCQDYTGVGKSGWAWDEKNIPLSHPSEVVCGATRLCFNYCSGIHVGVWDFGQGRFIVNTLNIAGNLGKDPAADHLFCNILNYASRDLDEQMKELPDNFNQQLIKIGYQK